MLLSHWRSPGCGGHGPCHRPECTHADTRRCTHMHTQDNSLQEESNPPQEKDLQAFLQHQRSPSQTLRHDITTIRDRFQWCHQNHTHAHMNMHTQKYPHIVVPEYSFWLYLLFLFLIQCSVCVIINQLWPDQQTNRHQSVMFLFLFFCLLKETLKSNHERSQLEKDFPRISSEMCSSDQLNVYSL